MLANELGRFGVHALLVERKLGTLSTRKRMPRKPGRWSISGGMGSPVRRHDPSPSQRARR
jgi:hypothetical protein